MFGEIHLAKNHRFYPACIFIDSQDFVNILHVIYFLCAFLNMTIAMSIFADFEVSPFEPEDVNNVSELPNLL